MDILTDNDYQPSLGCYIKFIHGEKKVINKLYSLSIFEIEKSLDVGSPILGPKNFNKYKDYLYVSVQGLLTSSDWNIRIYIDSSSNTPEWKLVINKVIQLDPNRIQIVLVDMPKYKKNKKHHYGLLPIMFRYLALFDEDVKIVGFRDIDNIWNDQHQYFVNKWLNEGREDLFIFLNSKYKRREIVDYIQEDGVNKIMYDKKEYLVILSGLLSIRKKSSYRYLPSIWQKMFAYLETFNFMYNEKIKVLDDYKNIFIYGFDELALTRILLPILLKSQHSVYTLPIKIYDPKSLERLFDMSILRNFFRTVTSADVNILKSITLNYWSMYKTNSGLSQYIIAILTNIFFDIITQKNSRFSSPIFINNLKYKIYPNPILMGIGVYTFFNLERYNWYGNQINEGGVSIVNKFKKGQLLTIEDFTVNSDLSLNDKDYEEKNDMY